MEQWGPQHHAFVMETFFKNGESVTVTQRKFHLHFNVVRHRRILSKHDTSLGAQLPYHGFCNEEETRRVCTNGQNSRKRARVDLQYATLKLWGWHYCSANFTPRFELPPLHINACAGVESTRFWQENNFRRDHVADVWGRSRTCDFDKWQSALPS